MVPTITCFIYFKKIYKYYFYNWDKKDLKFQKKEFPAIWVLNFSCKHYKRLKWIKSKYKLEETIYIGDGLLDYLVMEKLDIQSPRITQVILQKNIAIMF